MVFIGILLLLDGVAGIAASTMAVGDIGLACLFAGIAALLSGIGLLILNGRVKRLIKENARRAAGNPTGCLTPNDQVREEVTVIIPQSPVKMQ